MTNPNIDFITTVTPAYYGIEIANPEGEELLREFKALLGIDENDPIPASTALYPDPFAPPSDPGRQRTIQEIYMSFLSSKLSNIHQAEAVNALSPTEIEARSIIGNIFDIIIQLLRHVTDLQILNSSALEFLAKHQEAYAELMSRIFFYVGSGVVEKNLWDKIKKDPHYELASLRLVSSLDAIQTPIRPSSIASEFTLGYGKITLEDIFQYVYQNALRAYAEDPANGTANFILNSYIWADEDGDEDLIYRRNICYIAAEKVSDDEMNITIKFQNRYMPHDTVEDHRDNNLDASNYITDIDDPSWIVSTQYIRSATLTTTDEKTVLNTMNEKFQSAYTAAKNNHFVEISTNYLSAYELRKAGDNEAYKEYFADKRDLKFQWDQGILAGSFEPDPNQDQGFMLNEMKDTRAQFNQRLNTLVETIKSKIDLIRDRSDQQREVVESASQSRKMTSEILQSILRQLQNILASIFK